MSAVRELVQDGVNGFLVSDGSPMKSPTLFLMSSATAHCVNNWLKRIRNVKEIRVVGYLKKHYRYLRETDELTEGRPDDYVPLLPV